MTDIVVLGAGGPIGHAIERVGESLSLLSVSRRGPHRLDIDDRDGLDELIARSRPRAIAYLVNDRTNDVNVEILRLRGTLDVARRHGVGRFVLASSAAVYGDSCRNAIVESDPLAGTSDYARAKVSLEKELALSCDGNALSGVALRIFNVFGPGCHKSLINRLAFGPVPALQLSDRFVRDYVHVDEVALAFIAAVERNDVTGSVNIARGIAVDNVMLASAIANERYRTVEPGLDSFSVANVTRASMALQWDASIDPLKYLGRGASTPK